MTLMKTPITCSICSIQFLVHPYRASNARYCSRSCFGVDAAKRMNSLPIKHVANSGSFKPGQFKGEKSPKYKPAIARTCRNCLAVFHKKPWQLRNPRTGLYCSNQCRNDYRRTYESGKDSPFWKGGKTPEARGWDAIRLGVVEDQCGHCASCGKHVGASLPVHHIRPRRCFAKRSEADVRTNLIGLCQPCHMKHETNSISVAGVPPTEEPLVYTCQCCGDDYVPHSYNSAVCEACRSLECFQCGKRIRLDDISAGRRFCSVGCHNLWQQGKSTEQRRCDRSQPLLGQLNLALAKVAANSPSATGDSGV